MALWREIWIKIIVEKCCVLSTQKTVYQLSAPSTRTNIEKSTKTFQHFVKAKIDFEMWKLNPLNETQLQILQRWVLATCGIQINKMFVFAFLFET